MFMTVLSFPAAPMSCAPTGIPFRSKPQGTESPGSPARFTETVKISDKYIFIASSSELPSFGAVIGAVGQMMTSHSRKAASKPSMIICFIFSALL